MFCPTCSCEYAGWTGKCPFCGKSLVIKEQAVNNKQEKTLSYKELIDIVRENGGKLVIDVSTTEVGFEKKYSFPYFGYGFAWAAKMNGSCDDVGIDFTAVDIGKKKISTFPWVGLGYAWVKTMRGTIGGNEVVFQVNKVDMKKSWVFYFGFGFAWTQEMCGKCGDRLKAEIVTTDVGRKK